MVGLLLSVLCLVEPPAPVQIAVDPRPGKVFTATFTGPAGSLPAGAFAGSLTLNGSSAAMKVSGRAERLGERLRLKTTLRYADVPADWVDRLRSATFDYRLRAAVEGGSSPLDWAGTLSWAEVSLQADEATRSAFLDLASIELTALSARRGQGRAVLTVVNPFSFPLTLANARYRLLVREREVGRGSTGPRTLKPQKKNAVDLPFEVDPGGFLAAAGAQWALGGSLDSEIDLSLTFRLASGDRTVPLRLTGRIGTDAASSGPNLEGATSLPPHK